MPIASFDTELLFYLGVPFAVLALIILGPIVRVWISDWVGGLELPDEENEN